MADKQQDKAKRLADQYPDQPRQPQEQGGHGLDPRSAQILRTMIDLINMILSLFTGYRLKGGSHYQAPTARQIANDEITKAIVKDAATDEPKSELDKPFEIRRVARRLSRSEDPVTARLSANVLAALMLLPKSDLKSLADAPESTLLQFADVTRRMEFKAPATQKAAANDDTAALDVDPTLARRLAVRRKVADGEEVNWDGHWDAEEAPKI